MYDPKIDFDGDARAAVSRKAKSVKRLADQLKSKRESILLRQLLNANLRGEKINAKEVEGRQQIPGRSKAAETEGARRDAKTKDKGTVGLFGESRRRNEGFFKEKIQSFPETVAKLLYISVLNNLYMISF